MIDLMISAVAAADDDDVAFAVVYAYCPSQQS
jgi:hypothetical protein